MKVSIVTISFNQAAYLEQAIRSVVDQDYSDIEYIVIDAGSTDGSRDIIERYRHRMARVILEPDQGPAEGLNKGLAAATGQIFAYINADDVLLPGAVSEAVAAFARYPKADLIYGHGYRIDESSHIERRLRSAPWNLRRAVLGSGVIIQQATFIKRGAVLSVGGFNVKARCCWDYELLIDLAIAGKTFQRVAAYWGLFRNHGLSVTNARAFDQMWRPVEGRAFAKAMGRPHNAFDRVGVVLARLEKWVVDPKSFLIAIIDRTRLSLSRSRPRFPRLSSDDASLRKFEKISRSS